MTQTQKLDYFERRREVRISVSRKARIALVNDEIEKDCKILDESKSGARIEFHGDLVANDEVLIKFADADQRLATVRWFRGTKVGLELRQSPLTTPSIEEVEIAHDIRFETSSQVIDVNDDPIITITPFNILVGEEQMRFLGTPNLLSSDVLLLRQNVLEDPRTILAKSMSYIPGNEGEHPEELPKLILTGKRAFELFELDLMNLAIPRDHLHELRDLPWDCPISTPNTEEKPSDEAG